MKNLYCKDINHFGNKTMRAVPIKFCKQCTIAKTEIKISIIQGEFCSRSTTTRNDRPLFRQYEQYEKLKERNIDLSKMTKEEQLQMPFYVKQFDYKYGIKCGAFTIKQMEGERADLGPLFDMYYGAKFYESDQSWYTQDMFKTSDNATEFFGGEQ